MTRALFWGLLALMIATFAVRNVPWNLDDYDQAKQAFISWQIEREGRWSFQQTPDGESATKPPLMGWISALLRRAPGMSWDVAWRLPSFLAAIGVLWALDRGARWIGRDAEWAEGGVWWLRVTAVSAFGFNLITPRLATLVRTDMLLALEIALIGGLIWMKARTREPWSRRERVVLSLLVLASIFTKGPIVAVLVAPGLLVCAGICRGHGNRFAGWSGWWPWLLPLLLFGIWLGAGCLVERRFFQELVVEEFLGRVTGEHKGQPVYLYVTQLLYVFAPWSWLLIFLLCFRSVRKGIATDQATLWLVCWISAALVVMSTIPSKRKDRIFPLVPAMALLLPALIVRRPQLSLLPAALAVGVLAGCVSTAVAVRQAIMEGDGDLARFGRRVARVAEERGWQLAVRHGRDEGLPMYAGVDRFARRREIAERWKKGSIRIAVLPADRRGEIEDLEGASIVDADRAKDPRYFFVAPAGSGGGDSEPE